MATAIAFLITWIPVATIVAAGLALLWYIVSALIWAYDYLRGSSHVRASMRRAVVIKWTWRRTARLLNLSITDKTPTAGQFLTNRKTPPQPRIITPRLRTRVDAFSVTIESRAIGAVNARRWADHAQDLADLWRVGRVKVSSPSPGRVRARAFLTEPLEAFVPSPLITEHHGLWLPAIAPGSLPPDHPVLLMLDEDGRPIHVNLVDGAHMLIAGVTRSGKSITVNTLLGAWALMNSVRLRIIDANLGTVAPWWRTAHTVCDDIDLERPTEILREIREEMEFRKRYFWELRADKLTQFTPDTPVEVLVIDELANYAKHPDKKRRELFLAELLAVASQGHKFGVRLVLITQKPEADILPTSIRTNLSARICHRVDTTEDFKHAFPGAADMDITAADRSMPPGVAIAQLLGMPTAVRARSAFTPSQACWSIADAICARPGGQ
ncbi:FtsK/SpoIIIE domain-containing protein, partial [Streptosporangium sp. NPDC023825]|uniref:FtsK/SpoIIIE domain-containing protein n=1 Tax=Streptosporangium sp. NPDC023825 TaxID=3154909 RepID=UPI00342D44DA